MDRPGTRRGARCQLAASPCPPRSTAPHRRRRHRHDRLRHALGDVPPRLSPPSRVGSGRGHRRYRSTVRRGPARPHGGGDRRQRDHGRRSVSRLRHRIAAPRRLRGEHRGGDCRGLCRAASSPQDGGRSARLGRRFVGRCRLVGRRPGRADMVAATPRSGEADRRRFRGGGRFGIGKRCRRRCRFAGPDDQGSKAPGSAHRRGFDVRARRRRGWPRRGR